MASPAPSASVVILTRNGAGLLRAGLAALATTPDGLEVIVADNASTDATPAVAREFAGRFPRFAHQRFSRNLRFAAANNRAARRATAPTLLFLNNDVTVMPGAAQRLAATAAAANGVAGARLLFPDGGGIQHAGIAQMLWGYVSNLGTAAPPDHPALNEPCSMFAVTGAMLAIPRRLFAALGGFDERYHWGYEDVDLCLAARAAGAPILYAPGVLAVHAESATLGAARRPDQLAWNYGLYRRRWNHLLVPAEREAATRLQRARIRRVVVFGTGVAARGLFRSLTRHGIVVAGFTASTPAMGRFCGRPVVPLERVRGLRPDRLVVGSQHYYALRSELAPFDPSGRPLFPRTDAGEAEGFP